MNQQLAIIPLPERISPGKGSFSLTKQVTLSVDAANKGNVVWLQRILKESVGFEAVIVRGEGQIQLCTESSLTGLGNEGYQLSIRPEGIDIRSVSPTGVFYGVQTLGQMLPVINGEQMPDQVELLVMEIEDRPRYPWRGFMLDEGRHFRGKEAVKRLLDVIAALKMNIFHWHLTEDQGWRVEIKKYPLLTEIGAKRPGTVPSLVGMFSKRHDGVPHQGFYTQDDIREIVAYAAERHITVVPEIEMPGHSVAALAAYPEYSCREEPLEVRTAFGISQDVYCVGNEATFGFLEDILDEVIALFPGKYIHLGGDEVPRVRWRKCPKCQQRMVDEGLTDEIELHGYLINRMSNYLFERGKEVIGWNENLIDGLHPDFIIQYWYRGEQAVAEAIRNGRRVIVSPYFDYYLDHSYSLTPLSRTYAYQPGFEGLDGARASSILGVEAPLWTEFVPNQARLDFQTFPRLLAVAETGWTNRPKKDTKDFFARYQQFQQRLRKWGIAYAPDDEIEPGWLKRMFGVFTIAQRQTKTASKKHSRG
jgi:hexosaminidase